MSQCQEGKEKSKQSLGCNVGCNAAQIHSDVLSTETAGKCTGQALEGKAQRASSQDRLILVMCSVPSSKGRACKEQRATDRLQRWMDWGGARGFLLKRSS